MKKTYIIPSTQLHDVMLNEMMAQSIEVNKTEYADKDYEGGGDVKRYLDIWGDED